MHVKLHFRTVFSKNNKIIYNVDNLHFQIYYHFSRKYLKFIRNCRLQMKFYPKIQTLLQKRKFSRKYKFCSKSKILPKIKIASKTQTLVEIFI